MSSKNSKLEDSKVDDPYNWFKKEMKDNPAFEEQRFQQFIENRKSSTFEEKSKSKNFRDSDEGSMRGPGPLGFEGQAAYQFKPAGFQGIWLLFLISFFFTGIFTLVAGKVILDDLDNWDYVEDSDYEALSSNFKKPQARLTGLVMVISAGVQYLTLICDFYSLAVLAIGLPFFAYGDACAKLAWKRASTASKVMQVICYVNMIPRVSLIIISIYLGATYSPFIDPSDGEHETFVTGAIVITCVNLGFAPLLSLTIYLIYNLPITSARRRVREDRKRRGQRSFVYEPFRIRNKVPSSPDHTNDSNSLQEEEEEERERTFADRVLRRRIDGFHSTPIATRPINLMRDLMEIEETLREVVDENSGTSNVGPCRDYQLGLIPLCYYLEIDEKRKDGIDITHNQINSNNEVRQAEEGRTRRRQTVFVNDSIDLLGIEPLREIEFLSNSKPFSQDAHWLYKIEEEEDKGEIQTSTTAELSKEERARLRLIGMGKKGKRKARSSQNKDEGSSKELTRGVKFSELVGNDASTSSSNPNPNQISESNSNEFRIRLRPRPLNSSLKYPVLELPENQATCTICLTDYQSLDPALLEGEKTGASRDEASKKQKTKVEMKEFESMEPLRLLPCRHTFHKSCIDEWMTKSSARCVICQARVFPKNHK